MCTIVQYIEKRENVCIYYIVEMPAHHTCQHYGVVFKCFALASTAPVRSQAEACSAEVGADFQSMRFLNKLSPIIHLLTVCTVSSETRIKILLRYVLECVSISTFAKLPLNH